MRPESLPPSFGQCCSTARAIAADPLPAPTTIVRPLGGCGRCGGTQCSGSAALMAAWSMSRRSARGLGDIGAGGGTKLVLNLSDTVDPQGFKHLHLAGMIPGGAAMRGGGVEEFLAGRRIG